MSSGESHQELEEQVDPQILSNVSNELENKQPQQYLQQHKRSIEDKIFKSTHEEKLSSKMFGYARETICFFLAIVFTALAVLHSSLVQFLIIFLLELYLINTTFINCLTNRYVLILS